ncbi:MAG: D-alanyl-D-alanine dipeptidase [Alphaproteobacteria bacterium]|nr:D-alanyl-D-alanine dipeptidase [Alphaproteobacteria bacterium]
MLGGSSILVEILPDTLPVTVDLTYATDRNFTGRPVYKRAACFLHPAAAARLAEAARLAAGQGFRLKVFDAFRPTEAQWALWRHTPDPEFLADPRRGSPHSRGVAVDVTLTDMNDRDLDMGTPFDSFQPQSHHGRMDLAAAAQRNRALLLGIMTAAGWDFYRNEWWHYQLFAARTYPLLSDSAAGTRLMTSP